MDRDRRLWFRVSLNQEAESYGWEPDVWREPVNENAITPVLNDASLSSVWNKVDALKKLSGRTRWGCEYAVRYKKWRDLDNAYCSISLK